MKKMDKVSISAAVLTKNSSKTIEKCLKSLSWCDEVIVVDDFSADPPSLKLRRTSKIRIFRRRLDGDFAAQRNFALTKAKNKWVLFLDSDEKISRPIIPSEKFDGYFIRRKDFWLGREIKHGETNIRLLRLAKKGLGRWKRKVHEYWDVKGKIGIANSEILHYPHPSVREFVAEIANYSQLHGLQNKKEGKAAAGLLKVMFFPVFKFLNNFILRRGFEDTVHGFVIAGIMSFHSFLSWGELWLSSRKKKY